MDAYFIVYLKVDIYSLSRKWKELVDKARAKQLQPQEYSTGKLSDNQSFETYIYMKSSYVLYAFIESNTLPFHVKQLPDAFLVFPSFVIVGWVN